MLCTCKWDVGIYVLGVWMCVLWGGVWPVVYMFVVSACVFVEREYDSDLHRTLLDQQTAQGETCTGPASWRKRLLPIMPLPSLIWEMCKNGVHISS